MYLILSPSKRQNTQRSSGLEPRTAPVFQKDAERISKIVKGYSTKVLQRRLGLSEKLAHEVAVLWDQWNEEGHDRFSAIELFQGDVYDGLSFSTLSPRHRQAAQERILLLSALYGLLHGTDSVMPYRLDLNDAVSVRKKSLMVFWKSQVSAYLDTLDGPILDLTSQEYRSLIHPDVLAKMITVDFKEEKGGKLKTVSFFSKRSRGTFARWVIENEIDDFEKLKAFSEDGYSLNSLASNSQTWIFSRKSEG